VKNLQRVYVIGFTLFALVIIFSILVELDLIFFKTAGHNSIITVQQVENELEKHEGLERRRYLRSLEGRRVHVFGDVENTGLIHVMLKTPDMTRLVRVNFTRNIRRVISSEQSVDFYGTIRRATAPQRMIALELTGFSVD